MSKPIATVKIPKDHPMMEGHKPGDMYHLQARVPTAEEAEEEAEGEDIGSQRAHALLHVQTVKRAEPKPMPKKGPMEYLKGRQK